MCAPVPRVSVLTAVHNEAEYLGEMVDSVLVQTLSDFELIVVDDGSTDSTMEIAQGYAQQDPRIRVQCPKERPGKVGAFNLAYESSVGEVVVLCAGDDKLPANSLELRYAAINNPAGKKIAAGFSLTTFSSDPARNGLRIPRTGGQLSGGTLALSRSLADCIFPIPEQLVAEDVWIAESIRLHADSIRFESHSVLNYRLHPGNSNPRDKSFKDMSAAIHARSKPRKLLIDDPPRPLSETEHSRLSALVQLEEARFSESVLRVLFTRGVGLKVKVRALFMSNALLWRTRSKLFGLFSGR